MGRRGQKPGHGRSSEGEKSKEFRFQAKYALLTYAQCGELDPFSIVEHLGSLGAECIIGRENHAAGGLHLHAFVGWERKYSTRNCRAFDVAGHHPNIVASYGTPAAGWDYACKEGDIVAGGLERPSGGNDRVSGSGSVWAQIVLAETREEFFELCKDLDPRALCVNYTSLKAYADWRYRLDRAPYTHPRGLVLHTDGVPALARWAHDNLVNRSGGT